MFLIVKVKVLSLDTFKLVVLCSEHVDISYDSRVPKVVEGIINDKIRSAAGVEDSVISVFDTWTEKVGGRVGSYMKGGAIDGLVFAFCPLVDNPIVDWEVPNVFGHTWPGISANEDKGVVAGITRVKVHLLAF